ncbi:hypothetical protein evm_012412 [Chilo suppressalis]|nr:hypothetical protein evm_012412 [Chilo suppressalis]
MLKRKRVVLSLKDKINIIESLKKGETGPELLERENGMFKVKYLPPNMTSLLQPMDQSIFETLKRLYRKKLLRTLFSVDEDNQEAVLSFFKEMNLKVLLHEALYRVGKSTISQFVPVICSEIATALKDFIKVI